MPIRSLKPLHRGYRWSATQHGAIHVIYHLAGPDGQVGYVGLDAHLAQSGSGAIRNPRICPSMRRSSPPGTGSLALCRSRIDRNGWNVRQAHRQLMQARSTGLRGNPRNNRALDLWRT